MKNETTIVPSYGINQPYFLPYIGYFSLIKETDFWIVFDQIQFVRQSWGNRNRILKHPDGWSWINIPIKKHSRGSFYSQIEIQNNINWRDKLLRQLEYYKIHAPFYKIIYKLLEDIIRPDFKYLADLNIHAIELVCDYLNIPFNYVKYSDLNLDITDVKKSGDWGLLICKKLDVKNYINPYMGHFMFDMPEWEKAGIKLRFLLNKGIEYPQKRELFLERLSIIDVLMWNSVEQVHELMDSHIYDSNDLPDFNTDKPQM